jgi:hypothetical protein
LDGWVTRSSAGTRKTIEPDWTCRSGTRAQLRIGSLHRQDRGGSPTTVDQTATTTHTPAWAIVMVVLFIWLFFLSLLFLLAREVRVTGYVAIHIQSGSQSYTEQIPVNSAAQRYEVFNRVAYLQSLIGFARANAAR